MRDRVTLQGRPCDVDIWESLLRHPATETARVAGLEEAFEAAPTMALVFGRPEDAASLGLAAAAKEKSPPLALLLDRDGREHPLTRLAKSLVQAKRDWQRAFDAIVDPVLVLDAGGRVARANTALAQATGRPVVHVAGLHYRELLGEPEGEDPISLSLEEGLAMTREARYSLVPGVLLVTTSPAPDEEAGVQGVVVILKDVTNAKEQQERMVLAAQLVDVGCLAAGVAHEISTPLASISLRTESLRRSAEDPRLLAVESFRNFPRYLKTIEEEVFRCKSIIGALLEFSGGPTGGRGDVDINGLATRAADLFSSQTKMSGIEITLHLEPGLPAVRADEGQIRRCLLALLVNAIDATPSGGHIAIETRVGEEGRVCLSVVDDGSGIPEDQQRRLFTPFFTTKPVGRGTGLGLAVCHGIVTSHGGNIRVVSKPGEGTRVSVELPGKSS